MTSTAVATSTGWRALGPPAAVAAGGIGAAVLLHFHDPHQAYSYGVCPFHAVTGLWCPGCGGLRAVNDLTDGDVMASLGSNILTLPFLVVLAVAWIVWVRRRWQGAQTRMLVLNQWTGYAVLALLIVFAIVRNTPWGAWFAPA